MHLVNVVLVLACASGSQEAREVDSDLKLWYSNPAGVWNEALPVGN